MAAGSSSRTETKAIEIVLCLLGFVSAMVPYSLFTPLGGSWAQVVSVLALFGLVAILVVRSTWGDNLPPVFHLTVMLFYLACDFLLLSVGIMTAVRAYQLLDDFSGSFRYSRSGFGDPYPEAVAACAACLLAAFMVFFCDTFYAVSAFKSANANPGPVLPTVQTSTPAN